MNRSTGENMQPHGDLPRSACHPGRMRQVKKYCIQSRALQRIMRHREQVGHRQLAAGQMSRPRRMGRLVFSSRTLVQVQRASSRTRSSKPEGTNCRGHGSRSALSGISLQRDAEKLEEVKSSCARHKTKGKQSIRHLETALHAAHPA